MRLVSVRRYAQQPFPVSPVFQAAFGDQIVPTEQDFIENYSQLAVDGRHRFGRYDPLQDPPALPISYCGDERFSLDA
jgi:hypothetical protein